MERFPDPSSRPDLAVGTSVEVRVSAERAMELLSDHSPRQVLAVGTLVEVRGHFRGEWSGVQASFVDDPSDAVSNAARLVHDAMTERGYPDDGRASQIDMVSVDHPDLVQKFRSAHEASVRGRSGDAETEELRVAMLRYRAVFDRMLTPEHREAERSESRR